MLRYGVILLMVTTGCSCLPAAGEIGRQKRVKEGQDYSKGDYPFHVSLWYSGNNRPDYLKDDVSNHFCGGSLINNQWVLTAAHCISAPFEDTNNWKAYMNVYMQSEVTEDMGLQINRVFPHPGYFKQCDYHKDIALLKLEKPVDNVQEYGVLNTDSNCPSSSQKVKVIGWGTTDCDYVSNTPQISSPLDIVDTNKCNTVYNRKEILEAFKTTELCVDDSAVCAGVSEGGKNACYGDSGSPLIGECDSRNLIVGVVSYGYGNCTVPGVPSVFTRVSEFSEWIKDTIAKN